MNTSANALFGSALDRAGQGSTDTGGAAAAGQAGSLVATRSGDGGDLSAASTTFDQLRMDVTFGKVPGFAADVQKMGKVESLFRDIKFGKTLDAEDARKVSELVTQLDAEGRKQSPDTAKLNGYLDQLTALLEGAKSGSTAGGTTGSGPVSSPPSDDLQNPDRPALFFGLKFPHLARGSEPYWQNEPSADTEFRSKNSELQSRLETLDDDKLSDKDHSELKGMLKEYCEIFSSNREGGSPTPLSKEEIGRARELIGQINGFLDRLGAK